SLRHERAAVRERSLAAAGASLVAANDGPEVQAAALAAVHELLRDERTTRVTLAAYQDDGMVALTSAGADSEALEGRSVDPRGIPAQFHATSRREQIVLPSSTASDLAEALGFAIHPGMFVMTP